MKIDIPDVIPFSVVANTFVLMLLRDSITVKTENTKVRITWSK